jgi:hypothetical protein
MPTLHVWARESEHSRIHDPRLAIDERAPAVGIDTLAAIALRFLSQRPDANQPAQREPGTH